MCCSRINLPTQLPSARLCFPRLPLLTSTTLGRVATPGSSGSGVSTRPALGRPVEHSGTIRALTPARLLLGAQVSPLTALRLPIVPSPTTPCARPSFSQPNTTRTVCFRLRHERAGSPPQIAESGSSSYGPTIRLRLLPTPPHDDAVTFGYRVLAYSDTDFHRADKAPSRAHSSRQDAGIQCQGWQAPRCPLSFGANRSVVPPAGAHW